MVSALFVFVRTAMLSACARDTIDSRLFDQQIICHDAKETLPVSNADSFVHLQHGDSPGPCPKG